MSNQPLEELSEGMKTTLRLSYAMLLLVDGK